MKKIFGLLGLVYSINASAFFYCVTAEKTELGNPEFSISVFEPTPDRPYIFISLAQGDQWNVPQSYSCQRAIIEDNGVILEDYQCEGWANNLSVYIQKTKNEFAANIYSEKQNLEVNDLKCFTK